MISKNHIISEIQRTAQENGDTPLGTARFETETGIKKSDWIGKFWARWGDALIEAGFEPNELTSSRSEDELLECLVMLAREVGHFPVSNEIKLKARSEPGFPWHNTFSRLGNKKTLATKLREFSSRQGYQDVVRYCDVVLSQYAKRTKDVGHETETEDEVEIGYVYLLKSGRFYKIGRSNAVGRRERELAIQLPEEATVIHSIKTDDPVGIEKYWHGRFSDRRKNGEWFELTGKDITAFKRRKFM